MKNIYKWTRFLCRDDDSYEVDYDGLVHPPTNTDYLNVNLNLKEVSSLSNHKALAILGEPGMGKSAVLNDLFTYELQRAGVAGDDCINFDLGNYSTDYYFVKDVFESDIISRWANGHNNLYIFLDSLDECLFRVETASKILISKLKSLPSDRLFFRVACRTGSFPINLRDFITNYDELGSGCYEVLPLSRKDVIESCHAEGVDSESFINESIKKNAVSFISRPITLKFLLQQFKTEATVGETQKEIYEIGLRSLCLEHSESRNSSHDLNQLELKRKLEITSRIAFLSLFGNKSTISLKEASIPDEGTLYKCDIDSDLDNAKFYQVLDSGIFNSRGGGRLGWAHKSYSEFLAANFLIDSEVELSKLIQLTTINNGCDVKVIPQLQQVVKWIAVVNENYFNHLLENDIETIMLCDLSSFTCLQKEKILTNFLAEIDEETYILDYNLISNIDLKQFSQVDLEKIINKFDLYSIHIDLFYIVGKLIRSCELVVFKKSLLDIASDNTIESSRRAMSVDSLPIGMSNADFLIIKDILFNLENDYNDSIRGSLLCLLWPDYIDSKELFSSLVGEATNFYGKYKQFIYHDLLPHGAKINILDGIKWARKMYVPHSHHYACQEVVSFILSKSFDNNSSDEVLLELGKFIYECLKKYDDSITEYAQDFYSKYSENSELRRKVFLLLINSLSESEIEPQCFIRTQLRLLKEDDFECIVNKYFSDIQKEYYLKIARYLFNSINTRHIEKVLKVIVTDEHFKNTFSSFFTAIDLNSEIASELKKNHLERRRLENCVPKNYKKKILNDYSKAREEFSKKRTKKSLWKIISCFMVKFEDDIIDFQLKIEDSSLWGILPLDEKKFILDEVGAYFLTLKPKTEKKDLTKNFLSLITALEMKFLNIILISKNEKIEKQGVTFWTNWLPTIIKTDGFPIEVNNERLLSIAKEIMGEFFWPELKKIIFYLIHKSKGSSIIKILSPYLENEWKSEIIFKLKSLKKIDSENICWFETVVKEFGKEEVIKSLWEPLNTFLNKDVSIDLRIRIATMVLYYGQYEQIICIWPLVKNDNVFGEKVIEIASSRYPNTPTFLKYLNENELKCLFVWLMELYGENNLINGAREGRGYLTNRDMAFDLKRLIIDVLAGKGSHRACQCISELSTKYKRDRSLLWSLKAAKRTAREKQWIPYNTDNLLKYLSADNFELVRSNQELQILVIQSLKSIQNKSQGVSSPLFMFWNNDGSNYWPKSEDEISDIIVSQLNDYFLKKGIIINREVEIRKSYAKGTGQRVDILVQAIKDIKGVKEVLSVVVECKGIWNKDLLSSMESQLSDKYLKNNTECGIYLVYDTFCDSWKAEDRSAKASKNWNTNLEEHFSNQSAKLLATGYNVDHFIFNMRINY